MSKPFLSVIMPVYNTASYLFKSIQSVLNQSYKNLEFIIVNDGSSDDSEAIINNLTNGYNNVTMINFKENRGAGFARNYGLSKSKGEIIGFIDSDDWLDTNFYSCLIENMQHYQSDICVAGIVNEYTNKRSNHRYYYQYENVINSDFALELLSKTFNTDIYITPIINNKIYKRSLFSSNNLNFLENNYFEDDIISFWLLKQAKKISISSLTNYHYYQRNDSIMHNFSIKYINDFFQAFCELKKDIKQYDHSKSSYFYRYVEKCFSGLMKNLFKLEPSLQKQKDYIKHIILLLRSSFSEYEIIDIIGLDLIKRLYF